MALQPKLELGNEKGSDEVYRQIAEVYDPELDQPLTELGFIGGVRIVGDTVTVRFRLPTYWCAANFAYMMASDIRERVSELSWVQRVESCCRIIFTIRKSTRASIAGRHF